MGRIKRGVCIGLLLACFCLLAGCTAADVCVQVEADALTQEANELFMTLEGKHGVALYYDKAHSTGSKAVMYAVLYGNSGQSLSLAHSFTNLTMQISGEPEAGYSVWRVEYNSLFVRRASFSQGGQTQTMDMYEELEIAVEQPE